MAEDQSGPPVRDDAPTNAPIEHPGVHTRQIYRRLDELSAKFDNVAKPPSVRLADMIQLAMIVIGIIVAIVTAAGLTARMDDMRTRQSDAERRIETRLGEIEQRIDKRLDRIDEKVSGNILGKSLSSN